MEINIKGGLLDLTKPRIMGILNLTPDSFYDGGLYNSEKKVDNRVAKMIDEGVDIVDVGGYSSRPGAKEISIDEEIKRVIPTIKFLKKKYPDLVLSIDTFRSEVAQSCLDLGVDIVNDISAGCIDEKILDIVSKYNCPYVMMHMRGNPQNMQNKPEYKNVIKELISFFAKRIYLAREKGIVDIIIDPGFGFGKNLAHNIALLKNLAEFHEFGVSILAGLSRKSMIGSLLGDKEVDSRMIGSVTAALIAVENGANIIRTHDVAETKEALMVWQKIKHFRE